jgi:zinc transport system substrate-binding protein
VLTEKLVQIDSANAAVYRSNMQAFALNMKVLDERLAKQLKPLAGHGFAVYHEGYGHFINHYGLHQIDFITFTPEQRPGAKHLQELRQDLAKNGECIFMEPYYELQSVRDLARELKLRLGVLDALGTQNTPNYAQLLEHMASAFSACLTNRRVE